MTDPNQTEDNYSDAADSSEPGENTPKDKSEDESEQTALIPKAFFGSKTLEPGSKCEVQIEKVHEDEISVSLVPHQGDYSKDKTSSKDTAPDEMDAMLADN